MVSLRSGIALLAVVSIALSNVYADIKDPLDPFSTEYSFRPDDEFDDQKTPQQLIAEAGILLEDERPLDARTKLLKALKKDPKEYKAHIMLAAYYMVHVGHYRLSLRYIKQAHALFEEKNGKPPYRDFVAQTEHAHLLYLYSQARLNLDDYEGALKVLDEYVSYGYYADWYSGTRAWILMKTGKVEEAIRVAKLGMRLGGEQGRTLNMLGILLSMNGDRSASLDIFRQAINFELSLGTSGQPATPLNNMGEVYKEIFDEDRAESAWLKATSLPDGCEHVLPSLNLTLLYLDELNYAGAKRAMDSFQSCVAQFPLRNGEEHQALVNLARGRISLATGHPDDAQKKFEAAIERQQWFGKIGTNIDDLRVGVLLSLVENLEAKNNLEAFRLKSGMLDRMDSWRTIANNSIRAWWNLRKARQILIEDLSQIEDIYIRNTDSMISYSTLGKVLAALPTNVLEEKIRQERSKDGREEAGPFYDMYLAQNYLEHGRIKDADDLLSEVISATRSKNDDALRLQALLLKLSLFKPKSSDYTSVAYEVFSLSRPALRNAGFRLPVKALNTNGEMYEALAESAFLLEQSDNLEYTLNYEYKDGEYIIEFLASNRSGAGSLGSIKVKSGSLEDSVNKLTDEVFSIELK